MRWTQNNTTRLLTLVLSCFDLILLNSDKHERTNKICL